MSHLHESIFIKCQSETSFSQPLSRYEFRVAFELTLGRIFIRNHDSPLANGFHLRDRLTVDVLYQYKLIREE